MENIDVIKKIKELSNALYILIKNMPDDDKKDFSLQGISHRDRKIILHKIHVLRCACTRIENNVNFDKQKHLKMY